jgi:PAS fold
MARDESPGVSFSDLSAGGETGRLIRDKDWAATALGPRESWPRSLRNHLSMIFELPTAAIIFWGPTQVQLYNDGYSVIMGPRHPQYLGATFRECWPEAFETIHPWMRRVLENGETVAVNRTLVPLARFGFTEEAYFTFSFSPLRDDEGRIAGILQIVTEVTDAVLLERRTAVLHRLSIQTARAVTTDDALRLAADVLLEQADLPFSIVYLADQDKKEVDARGLDRRSPVPKTGRASRRSRRADPGTGSSGFRAQSCRDRQSRGTSLVWRDVAGGCGDRGCGTNCDGRSAEPCSDLHCRSEPVATA